MLLLLTLVCVWLVWLRPRLFLFFFFFSGVEKGGFVEGEESASAKLKMKNCNERCLLYSSYSLYSSYLV